MSHNPLVSVIIPTRNSAGTLKKCLQSIKNQTYKNIEIIVVDNHSTDETKAIARRYTSKIYNKGPERSAQRNFGAKKSKGEYLLFIDSDMELNRKVIEECVRKIQDRKAAAIIIPEESFGESFWAQCKKLEKSFYLGVEWIEAARFFDREIFFDVGRYNEKMFGGEDFDLHQKVREKYGNNRISRIEEYIYHNEGNLTLQQTIRKKSYYAIALNLYKSVGINAEYFQKQASLSTRYKLFFSNPKKLFRNPILGLGMLFMKTCEFGFAGFKYYFIGKQSQIDSKLEGEIPAKRLPNISFVIPVYNAEKYLKLCLNSIQMQEYPKNKIEIIIVDGGSTDKTLQIAEKYKTKILNNPKRIAEYGKAIGIKASRGEYFILLDSDNEIVEKDWLKKMIIPIIENPELFGVESPLSYDRKLSSLNRYFARIRIADPLAKYLVSKPDKIIYKDRYEILEFKKNAALVTGANGFLWNKKIVVEKGGWKDKFEEANYATYIHNKSNANYAVPYSASVRHYYCQNIGEYIQKRKKTADKFIQRWRKKEFIWLKQVNPVQIALVLIYLGTLIGPFIESVYNSIKHKTTDYLWHLVISSITVIIYSLLFLREKYV